MVADDDDDDDWDPTVNQEEVLLNSSVSLRVWRLWRATDYKALPGDLVNQPDWLLEDMFRCQYMYDRVKELAGGVS